VSELLGDDAVLFLPRGSRLKHCPARDQWVLLVPERVLFPCPTTVDILQRLERPTPFGTIIDDLAREYDAPEAVIRTDIAELITGLLEKGYVRRDDAPA
jgi:coenzyme PQQ biosynthesis protein PqqD